MRDGGADIANSSPVRRRKTPWNRSSTLRGTMPTSTPPRRISAADACTSQIAPLECAIPNCTHGKGTRMRVAASFFLAILATAFQSDALSLEQSAAVKVSTVLKTENSWDGQPIKYPDGKAEISAVVVEIAPGGETGWHLHTVPSFGMVLEGELEVQLKNGAVTHLKSGEALAEVVNTLHNGRNVGRVPVKLVVFYAGSVGQAVTIRE